MISSLITIPKSMLPRVKKERKSDEAKEVIIQKEV
jgi:hypothetical protein